MPGTLLPAAARAAQAAATTGGAGVTGFAGVWSATVTYENGAIVTAADGHVYISKVGGNLNHAPATSGAQWVVATA